MLNCYRKTPITWAAILVSQRNGVSDCSHSSCYSRATEKLRDPGGSGSAGFGQSMRDPGTASLTAIRDLYTIVFMKLICDEDTSIQYNSIENLKDEIKICCVVKIGLF